MHLPGCEKLHDPEFFAFDDQLIKVSRV